MKSKSRSEQREIIMKTLYQIFIYENNKIKYDIENIIKTLNEEPTEFMLNIINGILKHKVEIDEIANKHISNWHINRLGTTDRAILRMSIYEMQYTDTPKIVCINEAVELSKKYSDEKVKSLINGVLDKIYKENNNKIEN